MSANVVRRGRLSRSCPKQSPPRAQARGGFLLVVRTTPINGLSAEGRDQWRRYRLPGTGATAKACFHGRACARDPLAGASSRATEGSASTVVLPQAARHSDPVLGRGRVDPDQGQGNRHAADRHLARRRQAPRSIAALRGLAVPAAACHQRAHGILLFGRARHRAVALPHRPQDRAPPRERHLGDCWLLREDAPCRAA
jgi:hypothetical protein